MDSTAEEAYHMDLPVEEAVENFVNPASSRIGKWRRSPGFQVTSPQ
jgi:hypothetical protein